MPVDREQHCLKPEIVAPWKAIRILDRTNCAGELPGHYDPWEIWGAVSEARYTAAFLLSAASHMSLAGDLLNLIAGPMGYQAVDCTDGALEVREQAHMLLAEYRRLADSLSVAMPEQPGSAVSLAALRHAALLCLRRWQTDPEVGRSAMAVVMAAEWVQYLVRLQRDLDQAVGTARQATLKPWWR